ncbi:MAG: hypothetical protein ACRC9V_01735, partial [Aeromonas sp.]
PLAKTASLCLAKCGQDPTWESQNVTCRKMSPIHHLQREGKISSNALFYWKIQNIALKRQ